MSTTLQSSYFNLTKEKINSLEFQARRSLEFQGGLTTEQIDRLNREQAISLAVQRGYLKLPQGITTANLPRTETLAEKLEQARQIREKEGPVFGAVREGRSEAEKQFFSSIQSATGKKIFTAADVGLLKPTREAQAQQAETVVLHNALLKAQTGQALTSRESEIISKNFPEGLFQGAFSVSKQGRVDIHFKVPSTVEAEAFRKSPTLQKVGGVGRIFVGGGATFGRTKKEREPLTVSQAITKGFVSGKVAKGIAGRFPSIAPVPRVKVSGPNIFASPKVSRVQKEGKAGFEVAGQKTVQEILSSLTGTEKAKAEKFIAKGQGFVTITTPTGLKVVSEKAGQTLIQKQREANKAAVEQLKAGLLPLPFEVREEAFRRVLKGEQVSIITTPTGIKIVTPAEAKAEQAKITQQNKEAIAKLKVDLIGSGLSQQERSKAYRTALQGKEIIIADLGQGPKLYSSQKELQRAKAEVLKEQKLPTLGERFAKTLTKFESDIGTGGRGLISAVAETGGQVISEFESIIPRTKLPFDVFVIGKKGEVLGGESRKFPSSILVGIEAIEGKPERGIELLSTPTKLFGVVVGQGLFLKGFTAGIKGVSKGVEALPFVGAGVKARPVISTTIIPSAITGGLVFGQTGGQPEQIVKLAERPAALIPLFIPLAGKLSPFRVGSVVLPTAEQTFTKQYAGIYLKAGKIIQPLLGVSGKKIVLGTPKAEVLPIEKFTPTGRGFEIMSPLETKILFREEVFGRIGITGREAERIKTAREIVLLAQGSPERVLSKTFGEQPIRGLSSKGSSEVLKLIREEQGKLAHPIKGSFAAIPQLLGRFRRQAGDVDLDLKSKAEAVRLAKKFAARLTLVEKKQIVAEGTKIKLVTPQGEQKVIEFLYPQEPELQKVLKQISNLEKKALKKGLTDRETKRLRTLQGEAEELQTEVSSLSGISRQEFEGIFGIAFKGKGVKVEKIRVVGLGEQLKRKAASVSSIQSPESLLSKIKQAGKLSKKGGLTVGPPTFRSKDIPDLYAAAITKARLLRENPLTLKKGIALEKAAEKLKKLFPDIDFEKPFAEVGVLRIGGGRKAQKQAGDVISLKGTIPASSAISILPSVRGQRERKASRQVREEGSKLISISTSKASKVIGSILGSKPSKISMAKQKPSISVSSKASRSLGKSLSSLTGSIGKGGPSISGISISKSIGKRISSVGSTASKTSRSIIGSLIGSGPSISKVTKTKPSITSIPTKITLSKVSITSVKTGKSLSRILGFSPISITSRTIKPPSKPSIITTRIPRRETTTLKLLLGKEERKQKIKTRRVERGAVLKVNLNIITNILKI